MRADLAQQERASRRLFDWWAHSYEAGRLSSWFRFTQDLAIANLELTPAAVVLDVGCGTGYATRRLGEMLPAGTACGVDISPGMLEEARRHVPASLDERVVFRQANAADLPFDDASFTHVLCTNSFHHYPDPALALGEMRRVLVPGGQLVILENAPDLSWYTWAWDRLLRVVERGHVRYYPSRELGGMLGHAGFDAVELRVLRNEFLRHGKVLASIQLWSGRKPPGARANASLAR